jgi:hypothetical protein
MPVTAEDITDVQVQPTMMIVSVILCDTTAQIATEKSSSS